MTQSPSFPDKKTIAELTSRMLLEVEAVRFYTDKPFTFTSGKLMLRARQAGAPCRTVAPIISFCHV